MLLSLIVSEKRILSIYIAPVRSADNIYRTDSSETGGGSILWRSVWRNDREKNLSGLFSNAVISIPEFTLMMKNRHFWVGAQSAGPKWRSAYRRMVLPRGFFKLIDFVCFFYGMIYFQSRRPK
jgi:hypothetical protein